MSKALYLLVSLSLVGICFGSHGRYGSISFTKDPTNPLFVTFNVIIADRRSYFGAPNVGDTLVDVEIDFGDNSYAYVYMVVTSINTVDDWLTATFTGTHTFSQPGQYTASIYSCCRILSLNNNAGDDYQYTALVVITQNEINGQTVNNSPVSNMLPIINVPSGYANYQYQILALDPNGQTLTYGMASGPQASGDSYGYTQPPGLSVNAQTGIVTLGVNLGNGYWTTQQTVTNSFGNMITIDYLLQVSPPLNYCNGTCQSGAQVCSSAADCVACNAACLTAEPRIVTNSLSSPTDPATNLPAPAQGSTIAVVPGQTTTISFVVDDANLYNPATPPYIYTTSVPSFATVTAQKPCIPANGCTYRGTFSEPQFIQVIFNPTTAQSGSISTMCVGAKSLNNPLPYSQYCVNLDVAAQVCGNGVVEGTEVCDGGSCCASDCSGFLSSSSVCRASAGACDVAETCSGSSSTCPADVLVSSAVTCRASAGVCDVAEQCSGLSASCPADSFASSSTVCHAATDVCDNAETCSGTSATCPTDVFVPAGTVCRAAAGSCDSAETCSGSSPSCPVDSFDAAGTVCRASAGPCDAAETCSGSTASCPADSFNAAGTVCRASAGACDVAETCSGSSTTCPSDAVASSSVTCRPSAGVCDVAEQCSGSSVSCPSDSFVAAGTICHASTGVCDMNETCTGTNAACPTDALYGSSHVCRPAVDGCDVAEYCTLGTNACPADSFNTSSSCQSAAYVCPRLNNTASTQNYWCSPYDTAHYYSCLSGAFASQSQKMPCAPGTGCHCAYGVNCGLCGSPCTANSPGNPPSC